MSKFKDLYEQVKTKDKTYYDLAELYDSTYESVRSIVKRKKLTKYIKRIPKSETNKRREKTNLKRFGTKYYAQTDEFKEKFKQTSIERYGVENPMQIKEVREKVKKTMLSRYGVDNIAKLKETTQKIKETSLKRYGVENYSQTEEFKEKYRNTLLTKYGVEHSHHAPEVIEKMRRNFVDNEYRVSRGLEPINTTNVELLFNTEEFIRAVEEVEPKPTITEFIQLKELPENIAYNLIRDNNLQDIFATGSAVSTQEQEIYEFILSLGINEDEIERNNRRIIPPYELDIYLPNYNLSIEFNGTYWHSTVHKPDKKYHQIKALKAEEQNILLYQIFEYDWNKEDKREIIKSQLRNLLKKNKEVIYARNCEVKEVDYKTTKTFMDLNHLQGDGNLNKQINYGLYYNGELVYMMTFGKWRRGFKGIIDYEIFRSCSKLNTTVVGGASKLFKHFVRNYRDKTIGSYSSLQTGTGELYKLLGFEYSHITTPTSVKVDNSGNVYTLYNSKYQTSNLLELIEDKIYYEIYGTGSKLWIYKPKFTVIK